MAAFSEDVRSDQTVSTSCEGDHDDHTYDVRVVDRLVRDPACK